MSDTVIKINNLGKMYHIGETVRYDTFRDIATDFFAGRLKRRKKEEKDILWALKDISFEVKKGEVVGIIGRNGAGKSTLLKILSRITEPTEGRVEMFGRVGSLLEVGTGFHPELTGRENIYLNGAILGMSRDEIHNRFADIVAFSEIEKFIDTPVKRYSSGMYVRLAFAVAAHMEPEILIVDEVLSVGDAAFQKRCLGKMNDVAKEGRTILFVSHNMAAVSSLCSRVMLIEKGSVITQGAPDKVINHYLESIDQLDGIPIDQRTDREGDRSVRIVSITIETIDNQKTIRSKSRLKISFKYKSEKNVFRPNILMGIYDMSNTGIYLLNSDAEGSLPETLPPCGTITCVTDPINMTPGRCYLNIAMLKGGTMADYVSRAATFDVEADDMHALGKIPSRSWVLCLIRHAWSLSEKG